MKNDETSAHAPQELILLTITYYLHILACGCKKLKESEAKQLCINTFYPTFKGTNRDVIIKGNKCLPAPTVVGPVTNVSIKNLNINQKIDDGNVIEIVNPNNYINNNPYRVLINYYHPKFINLEINEETIPKIFKHTR